RAPKPARVLERGLAEIGLCVSPAVQARMLTHLTLLEKWNRAFNLTAIRDPEQMVVRHLLDSLALAPYVLGPRLIDAGSGAGFPGVPLALVKPDHRFALLERRGKRAQFLIHLTAALDLKRIEVVHADASEYRPAAKFDTLTARAFGSLSELLERAGHLCRPGGRVVAPKGAHPEIELAQVPQSAYAAARIEPIHVPGIHTPRHVIVLEMPSSPASGH
ncbi:MAG: 16S rRNA (guanine(527)-N(7))-methyltransferase RsmG, partial [Gammaproteobacteria bacterium]|nr:16S rRNA (guanine(527)-N(7))-methyltransferase RsmG [Gammaproteobacteria bacterium]